jgi:hypothetical protein
VALEHKSSKMRGIPIVVIPGYSPNVPKPDAPFHPSYHTICYDTYYMAYVTIEGYFKDEAKSSIVDMVGIKSL